ncbi:MAG: SDR family oxidoreductase [Candidatus Lokiarchaeota archaeon]|nr:SDR family oxidoreductase [Candidatus Lokiarchaeota archaeon]
MDRQTRWVLVTGASTGIGRATAEYLAANGFDVYAGARKPEDLAALGSLHRVVPLRLDVQRDSDVQAALEEVSKAGTGLFGIVNNAGIVKAGPLMDVPVEDMIEQFDVNVIGIHRVTRAFLPLVVAAKGRVVMMSSDSGFFATPIFGPYCASKFAVEGYADSLRREMNVLGVKVAIIEPGRIATPIWNKGEALLAREISSPLAPLAKKVGRHAIDGGNKKGIPPVEVAKAVHHALASDRPKERYIVADNKMEYKLLRVLPTRTVDSLVAKEMRKIEKE